MRGDGMSARDRFHATFQSGRAGTTGKPDAVFLMPQWTFHETRLRWFREGMPRDQHFNTYFGFDRMETIPLNMGLWPPTDSKVIEQTAEWRIVEDELGGITKCWSDREIGMSQWIRYPVRDRDSWEALKDRLRADTGVRYPEYWDDLKRSYAGRDYPLGINAGSYYGWLRNWVGMENLALWYYDCPDLVHEMTEYVADFVLAVIARALDDVPDIDYATVWEDMAMKTGPLVSPRFFREFMMGPLKRVTQVLNQAGIDIIMVDCDGNVDDLIPLWLEAKVNLVYPLEVAADCDAPRYREQFGSELRMIGNIDKRALRDDCDPATVEHEVLAKVPALVAQGGFSPFVDHAVPPDVPFSNFRYYIDLVHEVCG